MAFRTRIVIFSLALLTSFPNYLPDVPYTSILISSPFGLRFATHLKHNLATRGFEIGPLSSANQALGRLAASDVEGVQGIMAKLEDPQDRSRETELLENPLPSGVKWQLVQLTGLKSSIGYLSRDFTMSVHLMQPGDREKVARAIYFAGDLIMEQVRVLIRMVEGRDPILSTPPQYENPSRFQKIFFEVATFKLPLTEPQSRAAQAIRAEISRNRLTTLTQSERRASKQLPGDLRAVVVKLGTIGTDGKPSGAQVLQSAILSVSPQM